MTAYLPDKDGEITRCQAKDPSHCPYHVSRDGSPLKHYATREEAMSAYERKASMMAYHERELKKSRTTGRSNDYTWKNIADKMNGNWSLRGMGVSIDKNSGHITGTRRLKDKIDFDTREIYNKIRSVNMRNALEVEKDKYKALKVKPRTRRDVNGSYDALVGEVLKSDSNIIRRLVGSGVEYDVKPVGHDNELVRDKCIQVTGTRRSGVLGGKRIIDIEDEDGNKYEMTADGKAQPSEYYSFKNYEISYLLDTIDDGYEENEEIEDSSVYKNEDRPIIDSINEYMHSVWMDRMSTRLMNKWPSHSNDNLSLGAFLLKSTISSYRSGMEEVHYDD